MGQSRVRMELNDAPIAVLFDVGAELASLVLPGLGVGVMLSKKVKDGIKKRRNLKKMRSSKHARQGTGRKTLRK